MADPAGVLADIARAKRSEVAQRFDGVAIDALRARASPTRRSLSQALSRPGGRFILEIKKASPSAGVIRHGVCAARMARGYAGVADALSVLTDGPFFRGSLADLAAARSQFDGPILAKDFFLDPRQVAEARIAGADAVLVMLSLLDDAAAREIVAEARRLDMDALVEVHDASEMRRALALGARVIGINNRDLRDLSVDLATTGRLAHLAPGRVLVSESGIASRGDVDRLAGDADAFLVGTSLMRAGDPAEAARALVFGRVKLCGLNRREDFDAGRAATFAGLVFVPGSPRFVDPMRALELARFGLKCVGIFRGAPVEHVAETAALLGLAAVQLHGDEDAAYVRSLARKLGEGCEIWKAVAVGSRSPADCPAADRLLFDSGEGGTGRTFDWTMVRDHPDLARSFVAGGIGPSNAKAASRLGAYGLDVGSGVEVRPGLKSADKIRALFDALRPPAREAVRECA